MMNKEPNSSSEKNSELPTAAPASPRSKLVACCCAAVLALPISMTSTSCSNNTQTGALVGGLGGAAIGGAAKGKKGAVVGGTAGAIGGALIGNHADRHHSY